MVAPNERKVRIEVGYGLEDRLTDAESRTIIDQQMLALFRQGDFSAGTLQGAAAILRVLGGGQAIRPETTVSPIGTAGIASVHDAGRPASSLREDGCGIARIARRTTFHASTPS